jgi:hypothetical protein
MIGPSERFARDLFDDLPKNLYPFAVSLLEGAKRRAPKGEEPDPRHGRLEESGGVEVLDRAVIVFFDAIHAAKQHEDLRLEHPRGGEAKYLENELKARMREMEDVVAGYVRARTATGTTGPGFSRSHHRGG